MKIRLVEYVKQYVLALLFLCLPSLLHAQYSRYETNQIFIKLKENVSEQLPVLKGIPHGLANSSVKNDSPLEALIERYHLSRISQPFATQLNTSSSLRRVYLVEFPSGSPDSVVLAFQQLPYVEFAEKIPVYESFFTPNDPTPAQWNLTKIQASSAWDLEQGSGVVVAIVDDAVRLTHTDLQANIWLNAGEIPGNNIDDDLNGYIDDVHGYDVADNDGDPNVPASATNTEFTHGTHCAGIAAASTNNGIGIASIGFNSKIMAVKCKPSASTGPSLPAAYLGVKYAIDAKANVISMSWGGTGYSAVYQLLMDDAYSKGIVCVAAAGNSNTLVPMYPASYNHVISVAATDVNDQRAYFSNYGSRIDVCAPGVNIYSTLAGNDNAYGNLSGTSMACPLVSGLSALLLAYEPTLTPDQLESCLKSGATSIDALNPGYGGSLGAGRINAYQSLLCMQRPPVADFVANPLSICTGRSIQLTDKSTGMSQAGSTWAWSFPGGSPSTSIAQHPSVSYATPGVYPVTLTVTNAYGTHTLTKNSYITIQNYSAVLSGNAVIPAGGKALLKINFTGVGPWNITYSNGTSFFTVNGIATNPYYFQVQPAVNTTYILVSAQSQSLTCPASTSGQALVTIGQNSGAVCPGNTMFEKVLGGTGTENGSSVIELADSSFYVSGSTTSYGAGQSDFWVNKLSKTGVVQWSKTYGSSSMEVMSDARRTTDGGLILCGYTTGFGAGGKNVYLVKIDATGALVWSKSYGGGTDEDGLQVIQTSDGGYFVCGLSYNASINFYLLKVDASGTVQWSKEIDSDYNDFAYSCSQTADGGYVVSGSRQFDLGSYYDYFVVRLDASGNTVWSKTYGTVDNEGARRMLVTSDGSILVSGHIRRNGVGETDVMLTKIDDAGIYQWSKAYGGTNYDDGATIAENPDGTYVQMGFYGSTLNYGTGGSDLFLTKIDANGNTLWTQTYGGAGDETLFSGFGKVIPTRDGGYALVATTNSFGAGSTDVYFLKVDCNGLSECKSKPAILPDLTHNTPLSSVSYSELLVGGAIATAPLVSNVALVTTNSPCTNSCTVSADFSASDSTVCAGDTIQFQNLSSGASQFMWYVDGIEKAQTSNYSLVAQTGIHKIMLRAVGTGNCSNVDTLTVMVLAPAQVQILTTDTTFCRQDAVSLTASGTNSYSWSPSSALSCALCPNPVYTGHILTTLTVTGTDPNGCKSQDAITLYPVCCYLGQPSPQAGFTLSDTVLCVGQTITFTNTSYANPSNLTTSWFFGNQSIPVSSNQVNPPPVTFPQAGWWPVTLTVTDSCGTNSFTSYVSVLDAPDPNLSDLILCPSTDSSQIPLFPVEYMTYTWSPAFGLSDPTVANPWVNLGDTTLRYKVYIVDQTTGCERWDSLEVRSKATVHTSAAPDTTILRGESVTLKGCCGPQYSWTPAMYLSASTIAQPTATPLETTMYYLTVTDEWGCTTLDSAKITVMVKELFIPNLLTPNNDKANDQFHILYLCPGSDMKIYNRWGDLIYHSSDYKNDWEGEGVNDGVYYYFLEHRCDERTYKGWIQLIR